MFTKAFDAAAKFDSAKRRSIETSIRSSLHKPGSG